MRGPSAKPLTFLGFSRNYPRVMSATTDESTELVRESLLYKEFLAEREEILRHKWIESEKAGVDIVSIPPELILGHAGFPVQRDDAYFEQWRSEMSALGEAENVACKVSGFGMADNHWTIESIRPWVLHCIEAFGPSRIMFGTNWPVDVLYATYLEQTDAYRTILAEAGFSRSEQEDMLYRNAERLYRI